MDTLGPGMREYDRKKLFANKQMQLLVQEKMLRAEQRQLAEQQKLLQIRQEQLNRRLNSIALDSNVREKIERGRDLKRLMVQRKRDLQKMKVERDLDLQKLKMDRYMDNQLRLKTNRYVNDQLRLKMGQLLQQSVKYHISSDFNTKFVAPIITKLLDAKVIENDKDVSFELNKDGLTVNGVKQPADLAGPLMEQYIKDPRDKIGYSKKPDGKQTISVSQFK
jgi:hypothetical protein